jgi:hypothetical protein
MFKLNFNKIRRSAQLELPLVTNQTEANLSVEATTKKAFEIRPEFWLLVILNVIIFARLLSPETIATNDWVFWNRSSLAEYKYLTVWGNQEGLGRDELFAIPHVFQQFLLYYLALSPTWSNLTDHFFWFLILPIISNCSAWLFFNKISTSRVTVFTATLLYTLNTEYLARLAGGHNLLWFGYALAPLILWLFLRAIETRKLFYFLLAGLIISFAYIYDLRTDLLLSFLLAGFLGWQFLFDRARWVSRLFFYLKGIACILVSAFLLYPFFLLPSFFTSAPSLPAENTSLEALKLFSYADFWHALTLLNAYWPNFDIFSAKTAVPLLFYILPLLALVGICLRYRDKHVVFFSLVYLGATFLAKGANPPFEQINFWIFTHIPGFFAFREATKFYILSNMGFAFLVGVGISEVYTFISKRKLLKLRVGLVQFSTSLLLALALVLFILMLKPAFFQEIQGNFVSYSLPDWQKQLETAQDNDPSFYRTFWLPSRESISPFSSSHPVINATDLAGDPTMRPFIQIGDPAPVTNWSYLAQPEAADLLSVLGVKYIYVPNTDYQKVFTDPPAIAQNKSPFQLSQAKNFLDAQAWLHPVTTTTTLIPAYQLNTATQDRLFIPKGRITVLGSDDAFSTLDSIPNLNIASQNLVFLDKAWDTPTLTDSTLVFNQTNLLDYVANQIPKTDLVNLYAKITTDNEGTKAWARVVLNNKYSMDAIDSALQNDDFDYGQGLVYTKGSNTFSFSINTTPTQAGANHVLLRSLASKYITKLEVQIDGQPYSMDTSSTYFRGKPLFHWYDIGITNLAAGTHTITIVSKSDLNVLNLLALVPSTDFNTSQTKVKDLLTQVKTMQIESFPNDSFQRESVTTFSSNTNWNIVKSGSYKPSLHTLAINSFISAQISIDGKLLTTLYPNSARQGNLGQGAWFDLPSIELKDGVHQVSINLQAIPASTNSAFVPFDYALLNFGTTTFEEDSKQLEQPASLSYDYLSPFKYIVHIKNATKPFDLMFSDSYNPNWNVSYGNAKGQKPEEGYEIIQAYHINQTGSFDITLEYRPQKFVFLGMALSVVGFLIILLALFIFKRKGW